MEEWLESSADVCKELERRGLFLVPGTRILLPLIFEAPVRLFDNALLRQAVIGAYSYLAPEAALSSVRIGRYCSIGNHVEILSRHPRDWLTTSPITHHQLFAPPFQGPVVDDFETLATTTIGNDVWIGAGTQISSGVTIGDGAIVGAGALVSKNVEPFTIVAGVPARTIRQRFSDALIGRIRERPWWSYDLSGITVPWRHPDAALDAIERGVAADHRLERRGGDRSSVGRHQKRRRGHAYRPDPARSEAARVRGASSPCSGATAATTQARQQPHN